MPTPMRNVRVPEDVWSAALVRARADGTALSGVIVDALRAYGSGGAAATVAVAGVPMAVVADERVPPGVVMAVSGADMAAVSLASGSAVTLREVVARRARLGLGVSHALTCKCGVCKAARA